MADHYQSLSQDKNKENHNMNSLSNKLASINLNYNIGDEIFYPKNYNQLQDELKQNDYDVTKLRGRFPSLADTPNKYSIGQVLNINRGNYTLTITDLIAQNNQNISIHAGLITEGKFNWYQYNEFRRGVTVSFYDELSLNWNSGRIESVIDKSVGIIFGNDNFIMVPVHYLKQYEEIKEDDWSQTSDFVFKEYVRDVATEIAKKSIDKDVIDPDEFRAACERLGIRSLPSRTKAFQFFNQIKEEIIQQQRARQDNMSATFKLLMQEGHVIGPYKCVGKCQLNRDSDGVCLSNCKCCISKQCFKELIDNAIQSKSAIKCPNHTCNAVK